MATRFIAAVILSVVALAAAAPFSSDTPTQIHINQGDSAGTAMTVTWMTREEKSGGVEYGVSSSNLDNIVQQTNDASSYTYNSQYEGVYTSALIHHVTINDLKPSTVYYYRCGSDSAGYSITFNFTTPPTVGPGASLILNLVGDLGQTIDSASTLAHIRSDPSANMTLLIGDLSYADSSDQSSAGRNCTQRRWDSWGEFVQSTFAYQALMVVPGNHEVEAFENAPYTTEPFVAYQARFQMPYADCDAPSSLYYSFKNGPVHIIMLNSYMDFDKDSAQYTWFTQELKRVDRSVTPWLMVNMHAPWYNSDVHHHDEPEEMGMRVIYEPLFHDAEVDLVFAGHVHAYERMFPVYNNKTMAGATTFINIGDGGNREGPATGYFAQPEWSAYREPAFGHGRLHFHNATHAHWTWHKNLNTEPTISDEVWLVRNTALNNGISRGVSAVGGITFDGYRK